MNICNIFLQTTTIADSIANNANIAVNQASSSATEISYLSFILKGGALIIPIILLLFICIYIIVEKYLTIQKTVKHNVNLLNEVKTALQAGKIQTAINVCERDQSASSRIIKSGISIIGRPMSEIESVMERTTNIEIAQLEKGLGYLGLISGIAPILGFIGTISGVIKIFYTISQTENISIGGISGGLYEKMISSGAGLVVGVVAYSAYHLFNMLIDNFSLRAQQQILEIVNTIQSPQHGN
jgi:biopolymer transport protein ExbB